MSKKMKNSIIALAAIAAIAGSSLTIVAATNNSDTANTPATATAEDENTDAADDASNVETTDKTTTSASTNVSDDNYVPSKNKSETVYVNLNPYGVPTLTQVVNGYRLTGPSKITDYGNYTNITNLTNHTEPTVNGDEITFDVDGTNTFFYQGTVDHVETPWNINIKYKLNGAEVKAEDCAGASGMVETIIEVTPNENVSDYLKNNFFLQLSTSFDMSKMIGVEAEDAVVVDLGATRQLTFMAMPGESATFVIRGGSNCYEASGLSVVMAPLKMSALDTVSDLADAKDRMADGFDAADVALDLILQNNSSIQNSLSGLTGNLSTLKSALVQMRKDNANIDAKVDALIDQTNKLDQTVNSTLPGHIDTSIQFVNDINASGNKAVESLNKLSPLLASTKNSLAVLTEDCDKVISIINDISSASEPTQEQLSTLKETMDDLESDLGNLQNELGVFEDNVTDSNSNVSNMQGNLSNLQNKLDNLQNVINSLPIQGNITGGASSSIDDINDSIDNINDLLGNLNDFTGTTQSLTNELGKTVQSTKHLIGALSPLTSTLQDTIKVLDDNTQTATDTIEHLKPILTDLQNASDVGNELITDINETQELVNTNVPNLTSLLRYQKYH